MKTTKLLTRSWCIVLSMILFISCKKEYITNYYSSCTTASNNSTYHFPINTGSYWIYEENEVDPLGNVVNHLCTDSTIVTGDTIIGNSTFKIIRTFSLQGSSVNSANYFPKFLRDSLGFIVDPYGQFLDQSDFTTVYHYNITGFSIDAQLFRISNAVNTPAGIFSVIDLQKKYFPNDPNYPYGIRTGHEMYADSVGLIRSTLFFYSGPNPFERRLIRYNIN